MTIVVEANGEFEATTAPGLFDSGLVGTIGYQIVDNDGAVITARTAAGIIEHPAGSSIYSATAVTAPGTVGQYTIAWDDGSGIWASEDLLVVPVGSSIEPLPPAPVPAGTVAGSGPCSAWVDADYVLDEICSENAQSTDPTVFDPWITIASDLLFRMSGRQFPGGCSMTVRPCGTPGICAGWAWPLTTREAGWLLNQQGVFGWYFPDGSPSCGCQGVQRVHLPDYPVTAVTEVTIDGAVVDPATYALRELRFLDRLDDGLWPTCQDMRLELGEVGTWGVKYTWGAPIPAPGVHAAAVLACELYTESIGGECRLPKNTTQLNRQGISMQLLTTWGRQNGVWVTGITEVDAFLQSVNPYGLVGPTTVWSPDLEPFPRPEYA